MSERRLYRSACHQAVLLPIIWEGAHSKVTAFCGLVIWLQSTRVCGRAASAFPFGAGISRNYNRSGGLDMHRIGAVYTPDFCSFNYSDERCQPDGALVAWLAIASKGMEASLRMDSFLT